MKRKNEGNDDENPSSRKKRKISEEVEIFQNIEEISKLYLSDDFKRAEGLINRISGIIIEKDRIFSKFIIPNILNPVQAIPKVIKTIIHFYKSKISHYECSCSKSHSPLWCIHIVATLLSLAREKNKTVSIEKFKELVLNSSKEELIMSLLKLIVIEDEKMVTSKEQDDKLNILQTIKKNIIESKNEIPFNEFMEKFNQNTNSFSQNEDDLRKFLPIQNKPTVNQKKKSHEIGLKKIKVELDDLLLKMITGVKIHNGCGGSTNCNCNCHGEFYISDEYCLSCQTKEIFSKNFNPYFNKTSFYLDLSKKFACGGELINGIELIRIVGGIFFNINFSNDGNLLSNVSESQKVYAENKKREIIVKLNLVLTEILLMFPFGNEKVTKREDVLILIQNWCKIGSREYTEREWLKKQFSTSIQCCLFDITEFNKVLDGDRTSIMNFVKENDDLVKIRLKLILNDNSKDFLTKIDRAYNYCRASKKVFCAIQLKVFSNIVNEFEKIENLILKKLNSLNRIINVCLLFCLKLNLKPEDMQRSVLPILFNYYSNLNENQNNALIKEKLNLNIEKVNFPKKIEIEKIFRCLLKIIENKTIQKQDSFRNEVIKLIELLIELNKSYKLNKFRPIFVIICKNIKNDVELVGILQKIIEFNQTPFNFVFELILFFLKNESFFTNIFFEFITGLSNNDFKLKVFEKILMSSFNRYRTVEVLLFFYRNIEILLNETQKTKFLSFIFNIELFLATRNKSHLRVNVVDGYMRFIFKIKENNCKICLIYHIMNSLKIKSKVYDYEVIKSILPFYKATCVFLSQVRYETTNYNNFLVLNTLVKFISEISIILPLNSFSVIFIEYLIDFFNQISKPERNSLKIAIEDDICDCVLCMNIVNFFLETKKEYLKLKIVPTKSKNDSFMDHIPKKFVNYIEFDGKGVKQVSAIVESDILKLQKEKRIIIQKNAELSGRCIVIDQKLNNLFPDLMFNYLVKCNVDEKNLFSHLIEKSVIKNELSYINKLVDCLLQISDRKTKISVLNKINTTFVLEKPFEFEIKLCKIYEQLQEFDKLRIFYEHLLRKFKTIEIFKIVEGFYLKHHPDNWNSYRKNILRLFMIEDKENMKKNLQVYSRGKIKLFLLEKSEEFISHALDLTIRFKTTENLKFFFDEFKKNKLDLKILHKYYSKISSIIDEKKPFVFQYNELLIHIGQQGFRNISYSLAELKTKHVLKSVKYHHYNDAVNWLKMCRRIFFSSGVSKIEWVRKLTNWQVTYLKDKKSLNSKIKKCKELYQ